jgi:hypothetical protein
MSCVVIDQLQALLLCFVSLILLNHYPLLIPTNTSDIITKVLCIISFMVCWPTSGLLSQSHGGGYEVF